MKKLFPEEDLEKLIDNSEEYEKSATEILQSWKRLYWCHSQLVVVADIASLMAFFSITATVELPLQAGVASPELITAYVSTTCLLVGITIIVKIISSSILPHIECVAGTSEISDVHRSPHDQLFSLIRITCVLGHTIAPFLFCLDLILIAWVKYAHFSREAPMAVTAIIVPVQIVILIFGRIMYKRMVDFKDKQGPHLIPDRRYSAIAENWDEEDLSEESLLALSYSSNTSYGAVLRYESCNVSQMKVYADVFH